MKTRPEVHEWLKTLDADKKKELFRKFTDENPELFGKFLEREFDSSR